MGRQEWISFALLSKYKILRIALNCMKEIRSSCDVTDIFVAFSPRLEFLHGFS